MSGPTRPHCLTTSTKGEAHEEEAGEDSPGEQGTVVPNTSRQARWLGDVLQSPVHVLGVREKGSVATGSPGS